jgi:hypothetical protein
VIPAGGKRHAPGGVVNRDADRDDRGAVSRSLLDVIPSEFRPERSGPTPRSLAQVAQPGRRSDLACLPWST